MNCSHRWLTDFASAEIDHAPVSCPIKQIIQRHRLDPLRHKLLAIQLGSGHNQTARLCHLE